MQTTFAAWGRTAALAASTALMSLGPHIGARRPTPRADLGVVAISGVKAPGIQGSEVPARLAAIDSLIEARVRAQGFSVVPRDSTNALMTRLSDSIGVYDPISGARDTARVTIVEQAIRRRLYALYAAEWWLQPFIIVESVGFSGDEAKWRGTSEKTGALGGLGGALLGTKYGKLPALTLVVFVDDTSGRTVYRRRGGIQLLMKAGGFGAKPKDVPPEAILTDSTRNEHAVRIALDSLAARLGATRP